MKKFLRSPWLWIVVAVLGVLIALQYLVPNAGFKEVKTSTMTNYIKKGEVKSITFIDGGDQQMRAELRDGVAHRRPST